jgi:hypothetical protein
MKITVICGLTLAAGGTVFGLLAFALAIAERM